MTRPQLPGRIEALRLVLRRGTDNSPASLLRLAGMGKAKRPLPAGAQIAQGLAFFSGAADLLSGEREALPF